MSKRKEDKRWLNQEKVVAVAEQLFQPLTAKVMYDVRHRDIVGVLRQMDVGVIDEGCGKPRVHALVEVQKRQSKVGMKDFGSWIYKRDTLKAQELVAVSEKGFAASVLKHVHKLHPNNVRLGTLHQVEKGFLEKFGSTLEGLTRIFNKKECADPPHRAGPPGGQEEERSRPRPGYHPSQIFAEGQQQRQFATSAVRGSADTLCSARVFPGLTHFGHGSTILRYAIVILSRKALACSSASSLVSIP